MDNHNDKHPKFRMVDLKGLTGMSAEEYAANQRYNIAKSNQAVFHCADCKDPFSDDPSNRRSSIVPWLCETCDEYRSMRY